MSDIKTKTLNKLNEAAESERNNIVYHETQLATHRESLAEIEDLIERLTRPAAPAAPASPPLPEPTVQSCVLSAIRLLPAWASSREITECIADKGWRNTPPPQASVCQVLNMLHGRREILRRKHNYAYVYALREED